MADGQAEAVVVSPGDVVTSLRGRDRGTVAMVWGLLGRDRVAIVDGDVHPIARPKAKNRRHLRLIGHAAEMAHRMATGTAMSDGDISSALEPWRQGTAQTAGEEGSGDAKGG